MQYQWNKFYSNCTKGRVECTPTQPEANGNIISLRNEMHFTNGKPTVEYYSIGVCLCVLNNPLLGVPHRFASLIVNTQRNKLKDDSSDF